MKYALSITNGAGELSLDGDVTIESARELLDAFRGHGAAESELVVNMAAVRQVDVTCLQLFCAAHHAAIKQKRKLRLTNVGAVTLGTMQSLGFLRHIGCRNDNSGSCLWLTKGVS